MVNWEFVLLGNLIMDSAIALYAILSGMEAYYRRLVNVSDVEFVDVLSEKKEELEKMGLPWKKLERIGFDKIKKGVSWNFSLKNLKKAKKISPTRKGIFSIILYMFLLGIILQIIGIFFGQVK